MLKSCSFPAKIEPYRHRPGRVTRSGQARTDTGDDLGVFVGWVNDYCALRGLPMIPLDPLGRLNISRFRRTLAWFIRRRPRGLVAGAIQYGHVHTRLIQGYAGDYNSGFPDEYAFEDFLARLDELAADERALAAGEHVSGPAAHTYRNRIGAATAQFAGHVLTTGKQARDLLGNPLLQIFHGEGMTCGIPVLLTHYAKSSAAPVIRWSLPISTTAGHVAATSRTPTATSSRSAPAVMSSRRSSTTHWRRRSGATASNRN